MKVVPVACLEDNYAYLVIDEETGDCAAVDPVWPEQVLQAAQLQGATVNMVLTTHHHWKKQRHARSDEITKGNNTRNTTLTGPRWREQWHEEASERCQSLWWHEGQVEGCTHPVQHGDEFSISPSMHVKCIETPCHTKGHISYYITSTYPDDKPAVFTGDTLFIGGCGKFFEGTPDQMYESLCKKLASLPHETQVYCGHEYTQSNLAFALTVEPKNEALLKKTEWVQHQRKEKKATVPSTIGDELEFNPFMRVDKEALQLATGQTSPLEVMAEVRRMKDNFKSR